MLFNMNKKTGLMILQLFGLLTALLIPSVLNNISSESAVYITLISTLVVFLVRLKTTGKLYFSLQHLLYATLFGYGILSLLWAKNPSHHFTYLMALITIFVFSLVIKDYFMENNTDGFNRRLMYFFNVSGTICALINIVFWFSEILPLAKNTALKEGMVTSDFLGIFMALCMACTVGLYKNNSGFRKFLMSISLLMMLFVFFMAKSAVAWFFFVAMIVLLIIKSNTNDVKRKFLLSSSVIVAYVTILVIILGNSVAGNAFGDVFKFSIKKFFGVGAGFWSGKETFSYSDYSKISGVGLFPYIFASSGIIGFLVAFSFMVRNLILYIKLKNIESAVLLLLLFTLYLFPFGEKIGLILFFVGLSTYNEQLAQSSYKYEASEDDVKKLSVCGTVVLVLSVVLTILSIAKMYAYSEFKQGRYHESYDMYNTVASVNFLDSDSKKMAALSICNDKDLLESRKDEALDLINKAIKSDKLNVENIEIKANIYYNCENYDLCSDEYREIIEKVIIKDKYNLLLAESLSKIIENSEKGSSDAKRAYEEMTELAQKTENLVFREKISDLLDKSLEHTKGELDGERQENIE